MEILVKRDIFQPQRTLGRLFVDGVFECYTLEDTVRPQGEKVKGATAIQAGRYEVAITFSNRFQRKLPLLLSVPMFEGVRIHPGNTEADTEGCILVGASRTDRQVTESRKAFNTLFQEMLKAATKGKIFITVENSRPDVTKAA